MNQLIDKHPVYIYQLLDQLEKDKDPVAKSAYKAECNTESSISKFIKAKDLNFIGTEDEKEEKKKKEDQSITLKLPSQGRQVFTRWRWSYPNPIKANSKTFYIKYEKKLSLVDKLILNNFQNKYLYHAMEDIFDSLKSQPVDRDNLLTILYSPVLCLQNNFFIDFFDIWIDEIYINEVSKENKFLTNDHQNFEPFSYITLKLLYTKKLPSKEADSFW